MGNTGKVKKRRRENDNYRRSARSDIEDQHMSDTEAWAKGDHAEPSVIDIEEAQRIRRERRAEIMESSKYRKRRKHAEAMASARAARKSFTSGRRLLFLLIAIFIACIVIIAGSRINSLQQKQAEAHRDYKMKTEQRDRLENELAAVNDPEYIEAQARERLHMIKRGEILYIIENDKEDNSD